MLGPSLPWDSPILRFLRVRASRRSRSFLGGKVTDVEPTSSWQEGAARPTPGSLADQVERDQRRPVGLGLDLGLSARQPELTVPTVHDPHGGCGKIGSASTDI